MAIPISQYLAATQAAMQSPAPGAIDLDAGGTWNPNEQTPADAAAFMAQPAPAAAPYQSSSAVAANPTGAPPPQASPYLPANAFTPTNPIEAGVALAQKRGDLPPDAPPPGPSAGPTASTGPAPPQHPFPLESAGGGGVIPAHEVDLRGPSLKNAQGNYLGAVDQAIQGATAGGGQQAGREYAMALEAERAAADRQRAAEQVQAERADELQQMQSDFQSSAKALGDFAFKPDGGFWESRTTGQKIAGMFALTLNGFMAGGGRPVPDLIGQAIDRSVHAQENAYRALRDNVSAQQTAFGMAMQKYGSVDAARSMVRVAAIEGLQAQAAQVAALNKGTETGQRAMAAYADLEQQKMAMIAQGVRFLPSQVTGRRFVDGNTGLVYTEQEAKQLAGKWYETQTAREMKGLDLASDLTKDAAKAQLERDQYGALGKAGAQKIAEEQTKSQMEQDAILKSINRAQANVDDIVKGSSIGNAYGEAMPSSAPFAESAQLNQLPRETYNRKVMTAVAAAYKLSTDATEPKRKEMLDHYAEPFIIKPSATRDVALARMAALKKLVAEGGATKGTEAPQLPTSVTFHGR